MMQTPALLETPSRDYLDELLDLGVLEEIDYHFARMTAGLITENVTPEVLLGLALASRAVGLGHVCAELKTLAGARPLDREGKAVDIRLPALTHWLNMLANSALVALSDQEPLPALPLVLDRAGARLYLNRYWSYQHTLATELEARTQQFEDVDGDRLREGLKHYFGPGSVRDNFQRLAALVACMRNFCVISGGPGTGKTTTVTRILALLIEQAQGRVPKILLLAPTGKAAARLGESIKREKQRLKCGPEILEHLPEEGATIHRVLGWLPDRPTRFDHDGDNPLAADVVLVDEASMVDIGLLAKLVRAVPRQTRLILLGDKDQLASVEAGAILGDITGGLRTGKPNHYSLEMARHALELTGEQLQTAARPPQQTGIWDSVVHLVHSYRFDDKSGIGRLARAIQLGRADSVRTVLNEKETGPALFSERDVAMISLENPVKAQAELNRFIEDSFRPYLETEDPAEALVAFDRARLLCAHRHGPMGVETLNIHVELLLGELKLINPREPYYRGRPIMITRNDYQFNLFNGDIGIIKRDPESGRSMVFFPTREGPPRKLAPGHLPPHETVYAMTVHKSQGSEFNHVAMLLPGEISPIITRELIYTAVTRARHKVTLFGDDDVLSAGIRARITRASGLREALWGGLTTERVKEPEPQDRGNGWKQMELF